MYEQAARTLESVNFDAQVREQDKLEIWIDIAQAWFDYDDFVNAENFINKAAHIIHKFPGEQAIQLRFKNFQATIMDIKRKFNLAAWSYYSLSNQENFDPSD